MSASPGLGNYLYFIRLPLSRKSFGQVLHSLNLPEPNSIINSEVSVNFTRLQAALLFFSLSSMTITNLRGKKMPAIAKVKDT